MTQFLLISRDYAKILLRDGVVRILWYQTLYEQIGTNRNNRELRLNDETWKFIE